MAGVLIDYTGIKEDNGIQLYTCHNLGVIVTEEFSMVVIHFSNS